MEGHHKKHPTETAHLPTKIKHVALKNIIQDLETPFSHHNLANNATKLGPNTRCIAQHMTLWRLVSGMISSFIFHPSIPSYPFFLARDNCHAVFYFLHASSSKAPKLLQTPWTPKKRPRRSCWLKENWKTRIVNGLTLRTHSFGCDNQKTFCIWKIVFF